MTRGVAAEILGVSAIIALGILAGLDAVREIPPLADDFWLLTTPPVEGVRALLDEFGAMARPLGVWVLGALVAVIQQTGIAASAIVLVWRALTLALTYLVMRRMVGLDQTTALVALALFLLTPPACEAWTIVCTAHQALSAPVTLAACALFARSARGGSDNMIGSLLAAAGVQVAALALYEQSLLMIPAFALICGLMAVRRRGRWAPALATVATAGFVTAAWTGAMLVTNYAARRGVTAGATSSAEASDLLGAVTALWNGFAQHYAWRLAEYLSTGRWFAWDSSSLGVVAAVSGGTLAALVGMKVAQIRREPTSEQGRAKDTRCELSPGVHLVAAYAALLPIGFAYPGFTSFSRMFYLPGLSIAIAAAIVICWVARRAPIWTGAIVGVALAWVLLTWRDYLGEMRLGSRMLRSVASATLAVPASHWGQGVLIIAPDVLGTFSSAAVQSWTVRPATLWLWDRVPAGPLFFATRCEDARSERGIRNEQNTVVPARAWGRVVAIHDGQAGLATDVRQACVDRDDS